MRTGNHCARGRCDLPQRPLRSPPETGGWQLGDLDLDEYLAKFRDRKLVRIVAPISDVEPATVICGICGFALNEAGECPRYRLEIAEAAWEIMDTGEDRDAIDQVADWLDGSDRIAGEDMDG